VLHATCYGGDIDLVQTLINEHKCEVNAVNDEGKMPLNVAAWNGKGEIALCLINVYSCDPSVKGKFGGSVLHAA